MKQVDFYLISNQVADAKFKLASRLANKLQRSDKKVLVITEDQPDLEQLDRSMWSFSDTSFLAHERLEDDDTESRIQIGPSSGIQANHLAANFEVLINLAQEVPMFCHHFDRIAEIVETDESSKATARVRFQNYRREGFELKTHSIEL